jgi:endo-beta-N-acetylglucosaminidase D
MGNMEMFDSNAGGRSRPEREITRRIFLKGVGSTALIATWPQWISRVRAQAAAGSIAPIYPPLYIDGNVDLAKFLAYDPTADPNAKYFRSKVPIAPRIAPLTNTQAKPKLSPRPQVSNFSNFYNAIDNQPSYGNSARYGPVNDVFISRFLQYQDVTSYWQVFTLIPNPALTDAAHRNGSICIAFMFNDTNSAFDDAHFLQQDASGDFPVANQLVDLAHYFGFDGYMFDMEAGPAFDRPTFEKTLQFFRSMRQRAKSLGMPVLYLQPYASQFLFGPPDNAFDWEALDPRTVQWFAPGGASSLFLDYSWQNYLSTTQATIAKYQGVTPYYIDPFENVFFGLELEGRQNIGLISPSYEGGFTQNDVPAVIPVDGTGPAQGSLALFDPVNQTINLAVQAATAANHGVMPGLEVLTAAVYDAERQFWSGAPENPAVSAGTDPTAYGVANFIAERSVIGSFPFVSRFNTGTGAKFFIGGQVTSPSAWFNMGIQDILPTWQWWTKDFNSNVIPPGLLSVDYDLTTAWNGGSSLKISGKLGPSNPTEVRLFKTKLAILPSNGRHWLSLTYQLAQNGPTNLYLGLIFQDNPHFTEWVRVDDIASGTGGIGWQQVVLGLDLYQGRTIAAISLGFKVDSSTTGSAPYSINIGEIALSSEAFQSTVQLPSGFVLEGSQISADKTSAQLRLSWDFDPKTWYYDIYRRRTPNSVSDMLWLGRISCDSYYVSAMPRLAGEQSTVVQLVAVSSDGAGTISNDATLLFLWQG